MPRWCPSIHLKKFASKFTQTVVRTLRRWHHSAIHARRKFYLRQKSGNRPPLPAPQRHTAPPTGLARPPVLPRCHDCDAARCLAEPMNKSSILPPAPLGLTCPLWLLVEWAELFRNGLKSRSRVLLEVKPADRQSAVGERRLALVTWSLRGTPLPRILPHALREKCVIPAGADHDRRTVAEVFRQMRISHAPVWFIPLTRWGGAAVFVRGPADDPSVAALTTFNREGRRPRQWILPRPREYPAEFRRAYAKTRSAGPTTHQASE